MKPWHVLLILVPLVPLCGYLLYRISSLEKRVEYLYETEKSDGVKEREAGKPEQERLTDLEERLEKLEARQEMVAETANVAVQQPPSGPAKTPVSERVKSDGFEEHVVSVMQNEVVKRREEQLIQHRDFLMESRTKAIREFAKQHGLTRRQEAAALAIVADEADKMVEMLKSPDITEDLPKAADRWKEMLKQTDEEMAEVLDAKQMGVYLYLRSVEQQALMPWLPK